MQVDWQKKLVSRRFWVALTGFLLPLLVVFGIDEVTAEKLIAVVASLGVLIAYLLCETVSECQNHKNVSRETFKEGK